MIKKILYCSLSVWVLCFCILAVLYAQVNPVTNLSALTGIGEGEVDLIWSYPFDNTTLPDGSTYYVQHSSWPEVNWSTASAQVIISTSSVEPGNTQYWVVTELIPAVTHYFRLWISSSSLPEVSDMSNGATTWARIISPEAITTLSALPSSISGGIDLSWTSPGDDDWTGTIENGKYRIDYSTDPGYQFPASGGQADYKLEIATTCPAQQTNSYTITGLAGGLIEGATYYIRIWTSDENPDNWSLVSNGATSYAKPVPPCAITDLKAVEGLTEGKIELSWTSPGDDDTTGNLDGKFRIDCSTDPDKLWNYNDYRMELSTVNCPPLTAFDRTVTGLESGTTYYLRIWTSDEKDNYSDVSNGATSWAQVDVSSPAPITTIIPIEVGFRHVKLSWILPYGDDTAQPYSTWTYTGKYEVKHASFEITNLSLWDTATSFYISSATTITPGNTEIRDVTGLVNYTNYYFSIRTCDENNLWSDVSSSCPAATPYNTPPGAPNVDDILAQPKIVSSTTYCFYWSTSSDIDYGDYISSYTIHLSTYAEEMTIGTSTMTVNLPHPTTYQAVHNLKEHVTYWWCIYSRDSEDAFSESTFYDGFNWILPNSVNEPPYPFDLICSSGVMSYGEPDPANENIYLDWEDPVDPDPGDFVDHYELYWASYPGVSYSNFSGSQTVVASSFTITYALTENATHWWYVVACDSGAPFGYEIEKTTSSIWAFQVNGINEAPSGFDLVSPSSWSAVYPTPVVYTQTPVLSWEEAVDPDPGDSILLYQVFYTSSAEYTQIQLGGVQTSTIIPTLTENATYWWYVKALDNGLPSPQKESSSTMRTFVVNGTSEPPSLNLLSPVGPSIYITTPTLTPTFVWSEASESDPFDNVEYYQLYYSTDSQFNVSVTTFTTPALLGLATTHTFVEPFAVRTTYYWNVRAYDTTGHYGVDNDTFSFCFPNNLPDSFDVLTPTGGVTISIAYPTFIWETNGDPDTWQTVSYTLIVSSDENFASTLISSGGWSSDGVVSPIYLEDNIIYYWKVKAWDKYEYVTSDSTGMFTVNSTQDSPADFDLISPPPSSVDQQVNTSTPTLQWNSTTDPDPGDEVTGYRVYYTSWAAYGSEQDYDKLYAGLQTSTVTPTLVENAKYQWYVRAYDTTGNHKDTLPQWMYIDVTNEPPDEFDLIEPSGPVPSRRPTFQWQEANRTEPWEEHGYNLYYGFDYVVGITTEGFIMGIAGLSAEASSDLKEDRWYWWKVEVVDNASQKRFSSQTWYIHISSTNEPPLYFDLIEPQMSTNVYTRTPTFSWEKAADNEEIHGDVVSYSVWYSTSPGFSVYKCIDNISGTSYKLEETSKLLQNVTYYWKVIARDSANNRTESGVWQFYVTLQKKLKPPSHVSGKLWFTADNFTISWSSVTRYEDGTLCDELKGYNIYGSTQGITEGFTLKGFVDLNRSSYTVWIDGQIFYCFVRSVSLTGAESENSAIISQVIADGIDPVFITMTRDKDAFLTFSLAMSEILKDEGHEISIAKEGNTYEIKVIKDGNSVSDYIFSEPLTLSFEHTATPTTRSAVFWYNGVEYVNIGGEISTTQDSIPGLGVQSLPGESIYVRVNRTGKYQLRQISAAGDGFSIDVIEPPKIFTPNGDGKNDNIKFRYINNTGKQITGEIYNLSGAFICRMDSKHDQGDYLLWEGKDESVSFVRKGIYIYQIKCGDEIYNGTIIVVR